MIKLVIVESPYAGNVEANLAYARQACRDCIDRGETPFASHLLFPQFLDDSDEGERHCGINRGLEIGQAFYQARTRSKVLPTLFTAQVAFYLDMGWSRGMEAALEFWTELGMRCEIRRIIPTQDAPNQHRLTPR